MKRFPVIFFLLLLGTTVICQEQSVTTTQKTWRPVHSFGDFSISASPDILLNTPNGAQFAAGIKLRTFISKKISFDSDLVFGHDYIHGGPGLLGIPLWLIFWGGGTNDNGHEQSFQEFLIKAAIVLLSAEHLSYHFPLKNTADISPNLSLLRYKSSYKYGDYSNPSFAGEQLSYAVGIELNKYFGQMQFSPYAEINPGNTDHIPGYNLGIYCGYYFPIK